MYVWHWWDGFGFDVANEVDVLGGGEILVYRLGDLIAFALFFANVDHADFGVFHAEGERGIHVAHFGKVA